MTFLKKISVFFLLVALVFSLSFESASAYPYDTRTTITTGNYPVDIITHDFDGDGNLDLVVANVNDDDISVFMGNGDGTFDAKVDYPVGGYPVTIAKGDFDKDGNMDLVVVSQDNGHYSILLGNGNGTFDPAVNVQILDGASPIIPNGLAVADFDKDGNLDLAVGYYDYVEDGLYILMGNGDGTFGLPTNYASNYTVYNITTGDFNGDTYPDIAVINYSGSNTVSVYINDGDGTFAPKVDYPTTNRTG